MRSVLNISLPQSLTHEVDRAVKARHFASKSEFFRYLLREWLAGRLANELEEGREEYRRGKTKKLYSTKEIWI